MWKLSKTIKIENGNDIVYEGMIVGDIPEWGFTVYHNQDKIIYRVSIYSLDYHIRIIWDSINGLSVFERVKGFPKDLSQIPSKYQELLNFAIKQVEKLSESGVYRITNAEDIAQAADTSQKTNLAQEEIKKVEFIGDIDSDS